MIEHVQIPIYERKKMGLAASQARLLTITARKADCEFESMKLSHQKIALSRDMERISDEYQNAMNQTKLVYDYYGTGTSDMALTYGLLMTPSIYNDYYPKLVTDNTNRVVLSGPYAAAARAAGIPVEGYNGTPSSEVRNKFVEALGDAHVISASNLTNIESVSYNNAIGLGATFSAATATQDITYSQLLELIKANCVDTSDYGIKFTQFDESSDENNIVVMANSGHNGAYVINPTAKNIGWGFTSISYEGSFENTGITLYDLLNDTNQYDIWWKTTNGIDTPIAEAAYLQELLVGQEQSPSFLNWLVDQFSSILGGLSQNNLALDYAYNQVYDLLYPTEDVYNYGSYLAQEINRIGGNGEDREDIGDGNGGGWMGGYYIDQTGWENRKYLDAIGTSVKEGGEDGAYVNRSLATCDDYIGFTFTRNQGRHHLNQGSIAINLNNIVKVFMTAFVEYLQGVENSKYDYEKGMTLSGDGATGKAQLYEKNDNDIFQIKASTDVDDGTDNLIAGFYDAMFNRICANGWCENDNIEKAEYMQELMKSGAVFISSLANDGQYYQTNYSTDTYIAEVSDLEGIAQAEAKYNSEKAKIEHKENTIDLKMKNLDTEISSLTTEYDTMKGLISKVIEKSFKRYDA